MPPIDLNADLGEGFPWDEPLLDRVSSASICCGAHAGDDDAIRRTLEASAVRGVVVGGHPGYADREHFGRRERSMGEAEVRSLILGQLDHLDDLARTIGVSIRFLKPHGALYNQAQREPEIAEGVVSACVERRLPLLGLPGTLLARLAAGAGLTYVAEGFCDRRYGPEGTLAPRGEPGSILVDDAEIAGQVVALADRGLQTLCVHGDDPRAVGIADLARRSLAAAGRAVRPAL